MKPRSSIIKTMQATTHGFVGPCSSAVLADNLKVLRGIMVCSKRFIISFVQGI